MNAVTVKDAKKNLDDLIKKVSLDVEPTIICSDEGDKAVLLSLDEYNSLEETVYLLSNPANAKHLMKSISEVRSGKTFEKELIEP